MFDPERDSDLAFRFGQDISVSCMAYLAPALWPLGEFRRARELETAMIVRARETGHVVTLAHAAFYRAMFEIMRFDARAAEPYAAETLELGRAHGLSLYMGYGIIKCGWVRANDRNEGVAQMRQGLDSLRQRGESPVTPFYSALLAELEAEAGEIDAAVGTIDRTLAEIERTGQRTFEAEAHRIRGEILLKRDSANPAPAEDTFQTAIAIAKQQGARSWGLRAALALAKLYRSIDRPVEAHVVLAPALEGFTPTPEMPEVAAAHGLLAALADTNEVRADAAQRQRLAQLHVTYGNALFAARGYGAPETTAAFARARGLWELGCARAIGGRLRRVGRQLRSRRIVIDEGLRESFP
jgi:predicted ATPase